MQALTEEQRLMVCAYLLDRADQYETSSGYWQCLADVVGPIMNGEVELAWAAGELDDKNLLARVRRLCRLEKVAPR